MNPKPPEYAYDGEESIWRSQRYTQNTISLHTRYGYTPFSCNRKHLGGLTGNNKSACPPQTGNEHNRRQNTLPVRFTFIIRLPDDLNVIYVPIQHVRFRFTDDVYDQSPRNSLPASLCSLSRDYNCDSTAIRLLYDDTKTHSTTTEVI